MKPSTLNILFSEPDVFSVLIGEYPKEKDWQCKDQKCWINPERVKHCGCGLYEEYKFACEQSKDNAIRIENPELLKYMDSPCSTGIAQSINLEWMLQENDKPNRILKTGDIFQVEGFEYEVKPKNYQGFLSCCQKDSDCSCGEKVAILKLAKEEELKEQPDEALEGLYRHGYNEAIDDVLKVIYRFEIVQGNPIFNYIEKLKK